MFNPSTYYIFSNGTEPKYLGIIVHGSTVAYSMQKGRSGEIFLNYVNSVKMEQT